MDPLSLLKSYHQYLTNRPQQHTQLLVHQRLIYLMSTVLDSNDPLPKGLSFMQQLSAFINKVNIKVMANNSLDFMEKLNLISKCVDLLFYKSVKVHVKPQEKLLQLRAVTFNNLSCLYKENRQPDDALKALDVALEIEEALLERNYEDTYKSIASTYINKCVILSSMALHQQAIETIKSSLSNVEKYRQRFGESISEREQMQLKHMTTLAYFNIAVEHEHLQQIDLAIRFYEMAFKLAKELGNWNLKTQAIAALKKLKTNNRKDK